MNVLYKGDIQPYGYYRDLNIGDFFIFYDMLDGFAENKVISANICMKCAEKFVSMCGMEFAPPEPDEKIVKIDVELVWTRKI